MSSRLLARLFKPDSNVFVAMWAIHNTLWLIEPVLPCGFHGHIENQGLQQPDFPCHSAHLALEFVNERSHFIVLVSADTPNASCWMWPSKTDFLHLWSSE